MKKFLLSGVLLLGALPTVTARTWTDNTGRKIDAEFVSQGDDAVTLKLKNGKEVKVPFVKLSREDLTYLVELETEEAKKNQPAEGKRATEKTMSDDGVTPIADPVADAKWARAVPKTATLAAPIEVVEEKKGKLNHFTSSHFRIIADSRLKSKALATMLEACELTYNYCEALPFGLESRFEPPGGKFEIHTTGSSEDWEDAGGPANSVSTFDPSTGRLNLCLENMGLSGSGRGNEDSMRFAAGILIRHVTRCMLPEVYERQFSDWFKEGLPHLLNCVVFEKSTFDFKQVVEVTKELLLGEGPSGQDPIFEKEIQMLEIPKLLTMASGGVADETKRREFLGQSVLVMAYLVYMDDGGKATDLRSGLRYAFDFQKNFPKTIPAKSKEEFEEKKAALMKQRDELGEKATAMMFGERPWAEVEADMTKLWAEHGVRLIFPGAEKE